MNIEEKWKPIIDSFGITNKYIRKFISEYAEYHQKYSENHYKTKDLLPLSCNVLSKLNLAGKNLEIKKNQPDVSFSCQVKKDNYTTAKDRMLIIQETEQNLINQLIEHINKKLETKNNLYITTMINSIDVTNNDDYFNMILTSCCNVE